MSDVSAFLLPSSFQNDIGVRKAYQPFTEQLALTEATYTMLRILQTFKAIAAADDEPWKENLTITLNSSSGCNVRLYRA